MLEVPSSGANPWPYTDDARRDLLSFMSTCPNCKDVRYPQNHGFRDVVRSLVNNQPIEAHCAVCNGFWPINASERAELALLLITD